MTGTADAGLLAAMGDMLRKREGIAAQVVTGYNERTYEIGDCFACADAFIGVQIDYLDEQGNAGSWDYWGDLGEPTRLLTDE